MKGENKDDVVLDALIIDHLEYRTMNTLTVTLFPFLDSIYTFVFPRFFMDTWTYLEKL